MTRPGRVIFIAGGTGSIGSEIARQAIADGWRVIVQGRSQHTVDTALAALRTTCPEGEFNGVVADIRDDGAIGHMVDTARQLFGRIDAVVDCLVTGPQSGGITGAFSTTAPEAFAAFAEFSIVYLQRLAHAVLPHLRESRGTLVAFASDAGIFAAPAQTLIGSARAATVGFVRNLAMEVAREGVRAHCVCPGFVDETSTAQKLEQAASSRLEKARQKAGLGLPTPADIAPTVLFLCSDGARRMTGQVLSINGGMNA